jgi:hypothetical protein
MTPFRHPSRTVVWICLAAGWFLFRCGAVFRQTPPLDSDPVALIAGIQNHAARLETYQSSARFDLVSSSGSFSGMLQLKVKSPDSIWVKLEGPFGIDVGIGCFGRDSARVYSPLQNVLYLATAKKLLMATIMPFSMDTSNLALGLVGILVPKPAVLDSLRSIDKDGREMVMTLAGSEKIWIGRGPVVTRWEKRNSDGQIEWEWVGKDFESEDGVRLPRRVTVTGHRPPRTVALFFERIKTNRPLDKDWCRLKVPEGAEIVDF